VATLVDVVDVNRGGGEWCTGPSTGDGHNGRGGTIG
jgi:hypothetical protein